MRLTFLVAFVSCVGCSTTGLSGAQGATAVSLDMPASWQGRAADRMNGRASGPATPALRDLAGQAPLVYVTRVPAGSDQPGWELAVFDDGTLVYEGHRCVETGGLLLTRLRADALAALREATETLCADLQLPASDDELCDVATTLRMVCASHDRLRLTTDHCRERYPSVGEQLDAVVALLEVRSNLASWVGPPTRRLACAPGSRDLSPNDLARTIRSDLTEGAGL